VASETSSSSSSSSPSVAALCEQRREDSELQLALELSRFENKQADDNDDNTNYVYDDEEGEVEPEAKSIGAEPIGQLPTNNIRRRIDLSSSSDETAALHPASKKPGALRNMAFLALLISLTSS
jgi:hypothetical protein